MFHYKLNCLIFLMLSVVCFSSDNPGGSRVRRSLNGYTICKNSMEEVFGGCKDLIPCVKHAILKLKLYGQHRTRYPLHAAYYYQEFHLKLKYNNIVLPEQFCTTHFRKLNTFCIAHLKIFEEDMSLQLSSPEDQENILTEYDPDDVQFIKDTLDYYEAASSTQDKGQLNKFQLLRTKQMNVLMNALYYHKVVPEDFVLPNESSGRFFHKENSYGEVYLLKISESIHIDKLHRKNFHSPAVFCRLLYPRQPLIH